MNYPIISSLITSTVIFFLAGCTAGEKQSYHYYFERRNLASEPAIEEFVHCHGYGCKYQTEVSLTNSEWKNIGKIFHPKSKNAKQERERIEKAIGLFEQYIGEKAGTF